MDEQTAPLEIKGYTIAEELFTTGYPAGTGRAAMRRTIAPNGRLVRWLSASRSQ